MLFLAMEFDCYLEDSDEYTRGSGFTGVIGLSRANQSPPHFIPPEISELPLPWSLTKQFVVEWLSWPWPSWSSVNQLICWPQSRPATQK